jgi:hypothetical protein
MNATTAPPSAGDLAPDDLDHLLSAFFRAEVPSPWPRLKAPLATPAVRPSESPLAASRLVLAASVAALLAGGWTLSAWLPDPPTADGASHPGGATVPKELRRTPDPMIHPR